MLKYHWRGVEFPAFSTSALYIVYSGTTDSASSWNQLFRLALDFLCDLGAAASIRMQVGHKLGIIVSADRWTTTPGVSELAIGNREWRWQCFHMLMVHTAACACGQIGSNYGGPATVEIDLEIRFLPSIQDRLARRCSAQGMKKKNHASGVNMLAVENSHSSVDRRRQHNGDVM